MPQPHSSGHQEPQLLLQLLGQLPPSVSHHKSRDKYLDMCHCGAERTGHSKPLLLEEVQCQPTAKIRQRTPPGSPGCGALSRCDRYHTLPCHNLATRTLPLRSPWAHRRLRGFHDKCRVLWQAKLDLGCEHPNNPQSLAHMLHVNYIHFAIIN